MILKDELRELAERLDKKAVTKLRCYLDTNERRSTYDGADRLEDAERLLNCAAALRARASIKGSSDATE